MKAFEEETFYASAVSSPGSHSIADSDLHGLLTEHNRNPSNFGSTMQPMMLVPASEYCSMKVRDLNDELQHSKREIEYLKTELRMSQRSSPFCPRRSHEASLSFSQETPPLTQLQAENAELTQQNKKYAEAVEHLAQELIDLQSQLTAPDKSKKALLDENSKLKQENMLVQADLKASQQLIQELSLENEDLREQQQRMETQVEALKQRVVDFFFKP